MRRTDVFEVRASTREPEPRIVLARAGDGASVSVDAVRLLAQYATDDGPGGEDGTGDVLLVLNEDQPFEEQLHLVLVRGTAVLDHVTVGAPYASGIFREVAVGASGLRFLFENEVEWRARADGSGARGPGGLPAGAHRRGGWFARHHLSISREPEA